MKSRIYSSKLERPLEIIALTMILLLEGLPTLNASAAEGCVTRYEGNNSSRINTPPGLINNASVAAGVSHALALRHNTTKASVEPLKAGFGGPGHVYELC